MASARVGIKPMNRSALISRCGTYRYLLRREWNAALPCIHWIMLNPSTADAQQDDNTIRRVISFSQQWGYGSVVVLNLFAYRTPHPSILQAASDPVGPQNDKFLSSINGPVIAAWGAHRFAKSRAAEVLKLLSPDTLCLGQNKNGSPKHPLYVSRDTMPTPMRFPRQK
jgi:hypothetical protein